MPYHILMQGSAADTHFSKPGLRTQALYPKQSQVLGIGMRVARMIALGAFDCYR
jgi:hypothetical protein